MTQSLFLNLSPVQYKTEIHQRDNECEVTRVRDGDKDGDGGNYSESAVV